MRSVAAVLVIAMLLAGSIAHVDSGPVTRVSGGGSLTLTLPAGVQEGDLLLAIIGGVNDPNANLANEPVGWSKVHETAVGRDAALAVYSKTAGLFEPATVTFSLHNKVIAEGGIVAYRALNAVTVTAVGNSGSGITPTTGTVTGEPGDILLSAYTVATDSAITTIPTGMNFRLINQAGNPLFGVGEETLTTSGPTGSRSITTSSPSPWVGVSILLHENAPDIQPAILASQTQNVLTSEDGLSGEFTVALSTAPLFDVTVPVSVDDATEASLSTTNLVFTTQNWNQGLPIGVTGVDDAEIDGTQPFAVSFGPATSLDLRFNGLIGPTVTGSNFDNDFRRIQFRSASSSVTENAGVEYIPVQLNPAHDAALSVKYGILRQTADASDHTITTGILTFQPGDTVKFIQFDVLEDVSLEGTETVVVTLSEPTVPAELGARSNHTLYIRDNDAPKRVSNGVVALYGFNEGEGFNVNDLSAGGTDLSMSNAGNGEISWVEGGLQINAATQLTATDATAIRTSLTTRNALTLEAWVTPQDYIQSGPTRIIALETGSASGQQDVHMGQDGTGANFRLRTSTADPAANLVGTMGPKDGPVHVMMTHDGSTKRVYVDGVEVASAGEVGTYTNWDPASTLTLANTVSGDRPWLGTLHTVAVYNRALTPAEVAQNFQAGHRAAAIVPLLNVDAAPVTPDGITVGGARWGAWTANPGQTDVQGINFLVIRNAGDAQGADAVIDLTNVAFTGVTDPTFSVPINGNVRFGYWEDDEPLLGRSLADATLTWVNGDGTGGGRIPVTGSENVVYVTYEVQSFPGVLLAQQYESGYSIATYV